MPPKKTTTAAKKFLSEEMILDSDSDYDQNAKAPLKGKGKARASSSVTKKRTAASASIGEEPKSKHQKTFHPKPAQVRGKKSAHEKPSAVESSSGKGVPQETSEEAQSNAGDEKDEQGPKNVVERITGVTSGDPKVSPKEGKLKGVPKNVKATNALEARRNTATMPPDGKGELGAKTSSKRQIIDPITGLTPEGALPKQVDVTDFSHNRYREPEELECFYRITPCADFDLSSHLQKLKASRPTFPDFPMRGPMASPGHVKLQADMKNWRNYIRSSLSLKDYGLSLSFIFAKVDNAEGKAVAEPPAMPIFSKDGKTVRSFDELMVRMRHGKAVKATFVLKVEVVEEGIE